MNGLYVLVSCFLLNFPFLCNSLIESDIVSKNNELMITLNSINKVLNFMEAYVDQLNLDAFFGITLAQAQIEQAAGNIPSRYEKAFNIIRIRCQNLINAYKDNSIKEDGNHNMLFKNTFLNSKLWYNPIHFKFGQLTDFGLHSNWTADDVIKNKSAKFHGLSPDQCFAEVLENNCQIGSNCSIMMLTDRNDTLYVLTHRLLFMQLARGLKCGNQDEINSYTKKFCSLIWRDAKTLEYLDFPNIDIFLEQILLCGMEGFEEFFINRWRRKPIIWQTEQGCYKDTPDFDYQKYRRTANIIEFGCIDHTTGLGLATLSLNARYITYTMKNLQNM